MNRSLRVGDPVVVHPTDEDAYIFQFQTGGRIVRECDAGFMIELRSATGEWGPVPASRLTLDTDLLARRARA